MRNNETNVSGMSWHSIPLVIFDSFSIVCTEKKFNREVGDFYLWCRFAGLLHVIPESKLRQFHKIFIPTPVDWERRTCILAWRQVAGSWSMHYSLRRLLELAGVWGLTKKFTGVLNILWNNTPLLLWSLHEMLSDLSVTIYGALWKLNCFNHVYISS